MTDTGTGMSTEDAAFARDHARAYARPDLDAARADAYADWYVTTYLPGTRTLADLPGHDHAWPRFVDAAAAVAADRQAAQS